MQLSFALIHLDVVLSRSLVILARDGKNDAATFACCIIMVHCSHAMESVMLAMADKSTSTSATRSGTISRKREASEELGLDSAT